MTSLAHRNGGLIVNLSSGLQTTCDCCADCPCTMTNYNSVCDCCSISYGSEGYDGSYFLFSQLEFDSNAMATNRRGPTNITWQTGYPAALGCYFWWFNAVFCYSETGYVKYAKWARYFRLFQCEGGVLVNRTNEAVVSGQVNDESGVVNVVSTPWGYALKAVLVNGSPADDWDDLNGGCMTEVEDIEPPLPELVC